MGNLKVNIADTPLVVLETPVQGKDHTWHVLREAGKKASPYGLPFPALAAELPTSVVLDGVTINLKAGATQKGAPKRSFVGNVSLPSFDSERQVTVNISQQAKGWNVIVKVNRPGGGGGEGASDERRTSVLAGLIAE